MLIENVQYDSIILIQKNKDTESAQDSVIKVLVFKALLIQIPIADNL